MSKQHVAPLSLLAEVRQYAELQAGVAARASARFAKAAERSKAQNREGAADAFLEVVDFVSSLIDANTPKTAATVEAKPTPAATEEKPKPKPKGKGKTEGAPAEGPKPAEGPRPIDAKVDALMASVKARGKGPKLTATNSVLCPACNGVGQVEGAPCQVCNGVGKVLGPRPVDPAIFEGAPADA